MCVCVHICKNGHVQKDSEVADLALRGSFRSFNVQLNSSTFQHFTISTFGQGSGKVQNPPLLLKPAGTAIGVSGFC